MFNAPLLIKFHFMSKSALKMCFGTLLYRMYVNMLHNFKRIVFIINFMQ